MLCNVCCICVVTREAKRKRRKRSRRRRYTKKREWKRSKKRRESIKEGKLLKEDVIEENEKRCERFLRKRTGGGQTLRSVRGGCEQKAV